MPRRWRFRWCRIITPGAPRNDIKVGGESAFALLKLGAWTMRQGGLHFAITMSWSARNWRTF